MNIGGVLDNLILLSSWRHHHACFLSRSQQRPSADYDMKQRIHRILKIGSQEIGADHQTIKSDENADHTQNHHQSPLRRGSERKRSDQTNYAYHQVSPVFTIVKPQRLAENTALGSRADNADET